MLGWCGALRGGEGRRTVITLGAEIRKKLLSNCSTSAFNALLYTIMFTQLYIYILDEIVH
jgi:hypothetical protein